MPVADLLQVVRLSVDRGPIRALREVSLTVRAGEVVAVLGANGAGKSTLLRTISGLHPVRGGDILLDGRSVVGLPPEEIARAGVAHVPEGRRIFSGLTVRENLLVATSARGAAASQIQQTLREVRERFPILADRWEHAGWSLSGGEQQMLAIGRGLMAGPRVLMLDEPSLGLAPLLVRQMLEIVRSIRGQGIAVVLVEQNARAALRVADRAYVLRVGAVAFEGSASEVAGRDEVRKAYLGA